MESENKFKKVSSIKPYRGHTLYKIDKETLEISEAKFSTLPMKDTEDGKAVRGKRVIVEEGFMYVSALNETNVKKKLVKMGVAVKID